LQLGAGRSRKKRAARVRARKRCKSDADFSQLSSVLQAASLPRGGGRPECARSRLGPPADRFLTLMRVMLSQPTKRHNESNETVTPHRSGAGQRTGVCSTCQPAQRNEADGFGQRCARGRNARRHCLSGRPGGARTHPRVGTRLRARVERDGSVLRGESNLALRSGERLPCRRARGTTRESILLAPRVAARGLTYNPASQFAQAQKDDNRRYLDIASVFDGSSLKGKRVAITGGSRGLGLEIAKAAMNVGAEVLVICRKGSVEGAKIYDGVDVTDAEACASAAKKIVSDGGPVDVLINNAGYFYGPCEKVTENSLNFEEELKQIDICAVGPLRVSNALYQAGGLVDGSKVAIVTSRAAWTSTGASGAPDKPSSGEDPAPPRHRAGVASMAWRTTRRFSTDVNF
jgi:hypothetical protein